MLSTSVNFEEIRETVQSFYFMTDSDMEAVADANVLNSDQHTVGLCAIVHFRDQQGYGSPRISTCYCVIIRN